jgi:hypothetical protein
MTRFSKETFGVEHVTAEITANTGTRPLVERELMLEAPVFSDCCVGAKGCSQWAVVLLYHRGILPLCIVVDFATIGECLCVRLVILWSRLVLCHISTALEVQRHNPTPSNNMQPP